jgi:endo-1,4-beta-D-glucanase Y
VTGTRTITEVVAPAAPSPPSGAAPNRGKWVGLLVLISVVVAAVAVFASGILPTGHRSATEPGQPTARAVVADFLSRYVLADGRVDRVDQGGDTVSEGQAYALLMTAAIGDRAEFLRVWTWTDHELLQPDGLLAWRWSHGSLVSLEPASDADMGTAAALAMAGRRFGDPSLTAAARSMAAAILAREVTTTRYGPTLVAGPWAVAPTRYVNPSYLAPAEMDALASAFGGPWRSVDETSQTELEVLTSNGDLPSDWAVIGGDGLIHPSSPPGANGQPAAFGFDAVRSPIWMATSCSPRLREAAANLLPALERGGGEVNLNLGGNPSPGTSNPVGLLALAAGNWAAGHAASAWALLGRADAENASHPTYYGNALAALTVLAFDGQLQTC